MYHAACKVEFHPFNRSYSQLKFLPFYKMKYTISTSNECVWCTTQLAKLSLNHSIGRTHTWRFSTASAAATIYQRCHYVWACCASFMAALFSEPWRCGSTSLFSTRYVMSGSDWGIHSKSCCKTPLGSMAVSTAWQISRGPATSSTIGVRNVLCHIYQEQKKWWECDIHHTRSIKTNSDVNLSRKPGLDLCCDRLQHLRAVPRTCSFWGFTSYTYIDFARLITQIVFRMKCNQIQLS